MSNNIESLNRKLSQLLNDVELVKDMVKVFTIDKKIDQREGSELLRLISEAIDRSLQ